MIVLRCQQRVYQTLGLFYRRYRSRKHLAKLADTQLKDIGINRAQALCEARKPFWRA